MRTWLLGVITAWVSLVGLAPVGAEVPDGVPDLPTAQASLEPPAPLPLLEAIGTTAPPDTAGLISGEAVVAGTLRDGRSGWIATAAGSVLAHGGAPALGSMAHVRLNQPIVAMASTPGGGGYWLAASDGGIFTFGDAPFLGSTGDIRLARPIVDMEPTPSGLGYWLVADDGGVFTFGDAHFYGSMGNVALNQPIVGISTTTTGQGYWLVAHDGGVFAFGDAPFHGSTGAEPPEAPMIDIVPVDDGYWLIDEAGGVHAFGAAPAIAGSDASDSGPVVAAAAHGDGLWLTRHAPEPSMAFWQSGGLQPDVVDQVSAAAFEAGAALSINHTGTIPVLGFWRQGEAVSVAPPGWRTPFTARAVDPRAAASAVGGEVAGALERGEVVMAASSARRRGVRPGDHVRFVGWDGALHLRIVGAVVPDARVAATELTFAIADAARFGFSRPSSIWLTGIDDPNVLTERLTGIAEASRWAAFSRSWDPPRPNGTRSTTALKDLLGEFDYRLGRGDAIEMDGDWVRANIVVAEVPIVGRVRCHRAAIEPLIAALGEIEAAGLAGTIDVSDTRRYGGCWVPRRIRGASGGAISRHGWGIAFDVNPSSNAYGTAPSLDPRIVEIFQRHGFAWGGTWTRPDGMHFEWTGSSA